MPDESIKKFKDKIIKSLEEQYKKFFAGLETTPETKINQFSKFALPLVKQAWPSLTGAGDKNFIGSVTTLEEVDFEKLIPTANIDNAEAWFKEKFEEQDIDSSIRREILEVINEFVPLPIDNIHGDAIVGVQPLTTPSKLVFHHKIVNVENEDQTPK